MRKTLCCLLLIAGCGDVDEGEISSKIWTHALSLPGSEFEIDESSNLVLDGTGDFDWGTVEELRMADEPTGKTDNSYAGGSKESDACPGVTTGSIPNNKSDLLHLGAWTEEGNPGFLHLYWSRVKEPSGTTLMDFELNQSSEDCGNGVNPVRTEGDLLLEYSLEQGGATAVITSRTWDGTQWGDAVDLTALGAATGTINNEPISDEDSDGLGAFSERTFGEASLDLNYVLQSDQCQAFGSVFVKSRSSDSFNSQLKDFIAPTPVNVSNCGAVTIRKVTLPLGEPDSFDFAHTINTTNDDGTTFSLGDQGVKTFDNVVFGDYSVTEAATPGYDLLSIDCSSSVGSEPVVSVDNGTVTFNVDSASDHVDCTFLNRRRVGSLVIKKLRAHAGDGDGLHPHPGVEFNVTGGLLESPLSVTTDENGVVCLPLEWGAYSVSEVVPDGYLEQPAQGVVIQELTSCPDGPELTFVNQPLTNIMCQVDSIVDGGTSSVIVCDGIDPVQTGPDGDGSAQLQSLLPGVYNCTITIQ